MFVAGPLVLVLLGGCSQSYEPAKREAVESEPAAGVETEGGTDEAAPSVAPVDSAPSPAVESGDVQAGVILLTPPETWVRKPASSDFVVAEFTLPRAEGDARDGRLTVSVAGGSIEANVDRWRGQFGAKPVRDSEDAQIIAGANVTVVDFSGTFNDSRGPFAPGEQREGYRMIGAIIPVGTQLHFVKAYGPEKTIEQHHEAFQEFLQTLQIDGP
jgi:hypothetical protein